MDGSTRSKRQVDDVELAHRKALPSCGRVIANHCHELEIGNARCGRLTPTSRSGVFERLPEDPDNSDDKADDRKGRANQREPT